MQTLTILLDGLAYGMVLFLISAGLTITMGLMRVVNLAHGAFAMIGGYLGAMLLARGVPFPLVLVGVALLVAALGVVAERLFYRPLYRKGELAQVLLTIGLTFIAIAGLTLVFGPGGQPVALPTYLEGTLDLGFRTYPAYRLLLIGVGITVALFLWLLIDGSLYGARLRAAVDNPRMARTVGIRVDRLFAATFALGCGLAGIGGFLGASMLPLEPFYALKYLGLFFLVVAIGGLGSFKGSFLAALGYGMVETAGRYLLPSTAAFLPLLVLIALLLLFPHGLVRAKSA